MVTWSGEREVAPALGGGTGADATGVPRGAPRPGRLNETRTSPFASTADHDDPPGGAKSRPGDHPDSRTRRPRLAGAGPQTPRVAVWVRASRGPPSSGRR